MKKKCISFILLVCSLCPPCQASEVYNNAVKVTFLSWITGSTKISYERALPYHQTAEVCASMIGAGFDKFQNHPLGFTLRYGHKFFLAGNAEGGLKGFYVRPEAIYSHYTYDTALIPLRTKAQMGALLATTGYQTNISRFLIDMWVGAGYAFGTPAETGYHHGFALWDVLGRKSNNIAVSFSIKLGFCF